MADFVNKIFNDLVNKNFIERYSRYTSVGVVSAECFNRSIRNLLKKPVFERSDANLPAKLPTQTKQNNK